MPFPYTTFENQSIWARVIDVHDYKTMTCKIEAYPDCVFKYIVIQEDAPTNSTFHSLIAHLTENQVILDPLKEYRQKDIARIFKDDIFVIYLECRKMDLYGRIIAKIHNSDAKISLLWFSVKCNR